MNKGIAIRQSIKGHTIITYKGEILDTHYLSPTTDATREVYSIPEEIGVIKWLESYFAEEIEMIDAIEITSSNVIENE